MVAIETKPHKKSEARMSSSPGLDLLRSEAAKVLFEVRPSVVMDAPRHEPMVQPDYRPGHVPNPSPSASETHRLEVGCCPDSVGSLLQG